jgi:TolA-binding protein
MLDRPEDEVDPGTGEGAAYGGPDSDAPLFLLHPDDGAPAEGNGAQHAETRANNLANILKPVGSIIIRFFRMAFSSTSTWNAVASIVMAVTTIFYTVYAHRQWVAMSGQITVMRDANGLTQKALAENDNSLEQTLDKMQGQINEMHTLATNAGTQADRTKDLADRMKDQANGTKTIAGQAIIQAAAAQSAAETAARQTTLFQKQMILEQRPYMKIGAIVFFDIDTDKEIQEPIIGKALDVSVGYINKGKSQAAHFKVGRFIAFGQTAQAHYLAKRPTPPGESIVMPDDGGSVTAVSRRDDFQNQSIAWASKSVIPWDGSHPIYLFGNLFYEDLFGSTYCTEIAYEYIGHNSWFIIPPSPANSCQDHPNIEK